MSPIDNKLLVPRQEPLLLDYAPGAAAAYSLRKLSLSYTGPVVTVRRSSDNAEADFTASEIDDGTLLGWVGAGVSAYVKTWHDQSGNARNATQTTTGYQPRIVDAGTLETEGGKATVRFDGSDDWLDIATPTTLGIASVSVGHAMFCVFRGDQASGNTFLTSNYNSATSPAGANVLGMESTKVVNLRGGSTSTNTATATQDTKQHIASHLYSGGAAPRTFAGYLDGAVLPTVPADGIFTDSGTFESGVTNRLGRWGVLSLYFSGYISEFLIYPSDMTAQRQRIEGDMAWYY